MLLWLTFAYGLQLAELGHLQGCKLSGKQQEGDMKLDVREGVLQQG
jgi:hypothetical protein